jgi:dimethylhistidine N-methyltransferase
MSRLTADLMLPDPVSRLDVLYRDVLLGLSRRQKELPCKYFYDERGAQLFEQICGLEEYYLTRVEAAIMKDHAPEMAAALGRNCLLIEPGAGNGSKTRILLEQLKAPAAYIPIDISGEQLSNTSERLAEHFPGLEILPVNADFMSEVELPRCRKPEGRRAAYFPGSTIGNFMPEQARDFLKWIASLCRKGGALLIGVDLKKSPAILERAYNDNAGLTAAFNMNLLARLNRELKANFRLDKFRHRAFYNRRHGRVEMHLVSLAKQSVRIGNVEILFEKDETIHTENCYKFSLDDIRALAGAAGLEVEKIWMDKMQLFSVQYCRVTGRSGSYSIAPVPGLFE